MENPKSHCDSDFLKGKFLRMGPQINDELIRHTLDLILCVNARLSLCNSIKFWHMGINSLCVCACKCV